MKFTVASVLVAAIATISSAAAVPAQAAAASALPKHFNLRFQPVTKGSVLDQSATSLVTIDSYLGTNFHVGPLARGGQEQVPVDLFGYGASNAYSMFIDGIGESRIGFTNEGKLILLFTTITPNLDSWPEEGFSQVNGNLVSRGVDQWVACGGNSGTMWQVYLNPKPRTPFGKACIPITLKIVPL